MVEADAPSAKHVRPNAMAIKNFFFCLVNGAVGLVNKGVLGRAPIGLYLVDHVVCHAVCPHSMSRGMPALQKSSMMVLRANGRPFLS